MSIFASFRDVRRWLAEGDFPSVKTTTAYVDHVAEQTGAHTVIFDSHATFANSKNLFCATDNGSDIGATGTRFAAVYGTNVYSVTAHHDHIMENTNGHGITMDHTVTMASAKHILATANTSNLGSDTVPFGNLNGLQVFARGSASPNMVYVYMKHDGTDGSIESVTGKLKLTAASSIDLLSDTIIDNTKHIKCATGAGSDIGLTGTRFGSIFGTALYAVTHYADHIAENTGAHGIVFDNTVDATTMHTTTLLVDHIGEHTGAHTVVVDNHLTMTDAKDIILNATTGTKIGTGTDQKLAFHNSAPVIQRAGAAQVAPAAYSTGAFGLDSDAHMQALFDLVVELRAVLVEKGLMKGAA